jgi:hypothetical protein
VAQVISKMVQKDQNSPLSLRIPGIRLFFGKLFFADRLNWNDMVMHVVVHWLHTQSLVLVIHWIRGPSLLSSRTGSSIDRSHQFMCAKTDDKLLCNTPTQQEQDMSFKRKRIYSVEILQ